MEAGQSGQARAGAATRRAESLEAQAQQLLEQARQARQSATRIARGNQGEQVIGALLEQLNPDGWTVLHDRRKQPGSPANLDHVLIGPAGVFVIDAKNWTGGRLRFDDRGMAVGRWRNDDELHTAKVDADIVSKHVRALVPHAQTVGVLAFVQDMGLLGPVQHQQVLLMQREHLLPALRRLPTLLTAAEVSTLTATLDQHLPARLGASRPGGPRRAAGPAPVLTDPVTTTSSPPRTDRAPATAPSWTATTPTAQQQRKARARNKARRELKTLAVKLVVIAACVPAMPWVVEHIVSAASPYFIEHLVPATPSPPATVPPSPGAAPSTAPRS